MFKTDVLLSKSLTIKMPYLDGYGIFCMSSIRLLLDTYDLRRCFVKYRIVLIFWMLVYVGFDIGADRFDPQVLSCCIV